MASFVVYKKIPPTKLRKIAKDAIKGITKWFEDNPKRRVCRAQFWYGRGYTIKRATVTQQIEKLLEDVLKED